MRSLGKFNEENIGVGENQVKLENKVVDEEQAMLNYAIMENEAKLRGLARGPHGEEFATAEEFEDINIDVAVTILECIGDAWRLRSKVPENLEAWMQSVDIDVEKALEVLQTYVDHIPDPGDEESVLVLGPDGRPSKEHILLESTMKELDRISSALLVLSDIAVRQKFDVKHSLSASNLSKSIAKKIRGWKKVTTASERQSALGNRQVIGQIQVSVLLGSKYPKLLE